MNVKVKCINGFFDLEAGKNRVVGDEWETNINRANVLKNWKPSLVEILVTVKEEKQEHAVIEEDVEKTINEVETKKAIIPKKKIEKNKR